MPLNNTIDEMDSKERLKQEVAARQQRLAEQRQQAQQIFTQQFGEYLDERMGKTQAQPVANEPVPPMRREVQPPVSAPQPGVAEDVPVWENDWRRDPWPNNTPPMPYGDTAHADNFQGVYGDQIPSSQRNGTSDISPLGYADKAHGEDFKSVYPEVDDEFDDSDLDWSQTALASELAPEPEPEEEYVEPVHTPIEVRSEEERSKLQQDLQNLSANTKVGPDYTPIQPNPPFPEKKGTDYSEYFSKLERDHNLPYGYLNRLAEIESGGRPDAANPNSSARGMFQFMPKTAAQYGLKDANNPVEAGSAAARLAQDNANTLRQLIGREPTAEELYLAHQQGATGAAALINNPDARAIDVVKPSHITGNGGNEFMTSREFMQKWAGKYGGYNENPYNLPPDNRLRDEHGNPLPENNEGRGPDPVQQATNAGMPEATSRFMASGNIPWDGNGRATIDSANMGLDFSTGFIHKDRSTSDLGALFQGLLTGGIAALIAKAAGGDPESVRTAFYLAGTNRFGDAINQRARYENLEAMKKQGYTPQSIEDWIQTGEKDKLEKFKIEDWKEWPGDPTIMYRNLPNGKTDLMKVPPKYTAREVKRGFKTYQRMMDPQGNWRMVPGKDANGNDIMVPYEVEIDNGERAYQEWLYRYGPNKQTSTGGSSTTKNSTFLTPDKKIIQARWDPVSKTYRDPLNFAQPANIPQGSTEIDQTNIKDYLKTESENAAADASLQGGVAEVSLATQPLRNADGAYIYEAPEQSNMALTAAAKGNWALLGGGRGKLPMLENVLTSGNDEQSRKLRSAVNAAINVQGIVRNKAIAVAKAAGASGINTMAEFRLFTESFPPVDFNSYENMVHSVEHLEKYFEKYAEIYKKKILSSPEVMKGKEGGLEFSVRDGDYASAYAADGSARQREFSEEEAANSQTFTSSNGISFKVVKP